MSTEINKTIVRRYFDELWNQRDLATADQIVMPNVIGHVADNRLSGVHALKQRVQAAHEVYTNLRFRIEDLIADRDKVVARWSQTGIHTGPYEGHSPTGRHVMTSGINIFRLANGKIVEIWVNSDDLGELHQLGVLPLPNYSG
ncbi:MAG: ester cyclase [Chloroflexi bacterium]|nr:ester cyclase [Chloroflexota bacterium]